MHFILLSYYEFEFNQRLSITLKYENAKIYCVSLD